MSTIEESLDTPIRPRSADGFHFRDIAGKLRADRVKV
jgi:hypothetical protein